MTDDPREPMESALKNVPGIPPPSERVFKPKHRPRSLTVEEHVAGVKAGDRTVIGKTPSLVHRSLPAHREQCAAIMEKLSPRSGGAIRLGITGVPGVGKSTFIEGFGMKLIEQGHRVAVLAVDPSSEVTGGSILGDKTRMENLSRNENAIVRPSPSGSWLGGVARGTRESIIVCEAAGYDVVIIETVGVGQSEIQVASMVDFFLLLMLAGAGDELQGIKRGIIEVADAIAINKADGDNRDKATLAKAQYQNALHLLKPTTEGWSPRVHTCSAISGMGLDEIWKTIQAHRKLLDETGELDRKRSQQVIYWLKQTIEYRLVSDFYRQPIVKKELEFLQQEAVEGRISPFAAAEKLVGLVSRIDDWESKPDVHHLASEKEQKP